VCKSKTTSFISLLYTHAPARVSSTVLPIIILPAYMTALGLRTPLRSGVVATVSLLGTALLTLITGWSAPRHDLRALAGFWRG